MIEIPGVGVEVVLTAVVAAVGWLLHTVIRHNNELAVLNAEAKARREVDDNVVKQLDAISMKLDSVHGDMHRAVERTDWLMRTTDRHERWLDAGRGDPDPSRKAA